MKDNIARPGCLRARLKRAQDGVSSPLKHVHAAPAAAECDVGIKDVSYLTAAMSSAMKHCTGYDS